jgi:hypothetical protein
MRQPLQTTLIYIFMLFGQNFVLCDSFFSSDVLLSKKTCSACSGDLINLPGFYF